MSIPLTIGLGVVSMLIAGLVVKPLIGFGGGIISAIIIAIILLVIYGRVADHGHHRSRPATR
jgi:hypothetical protein